MSATRSHQVVIVDDDDDARDAFAIYLRTVGFDVAPAWGVEDALRQLRAGFHPCVVLLDLHMPGLDGWALLAHMRNDPHLADVPAIIVSSDGGAGSRARELGRELVLKPVQPAALVAAIDRHCRRHVPSG